MLAVLAEVLGSVKVAGSLELVSCLLETLNKVTHTVAPDAADRRFVEQLIMSAVENVVQQFPVSVKVCSCSDQTDRVFPRRLRPLFHLVRSAWIHSSRFYEVSSSSHKHRLYIDQFVASDNPQSFHQASLLMASLARIAPDAVLHNVMPIFTFMGSNVFHRDDTYSFRVVQKVSVSRSTLDTPGSNFLDRLSTALCPSWLHL